LVPLSVALFEPFIVTCEIEGACPILFHRWSVESVEEKAAAAKGSRAKKTDDVESYVYRNDDGMICVPGEYIRQSIIHAAKFRQDPRSPRKSLMDLAKASVFPMNLYYPIISAKTGKPVKEWDMLDRRRVVVQRNGITRSRPAFLAGWKVKAELRCDPQLALVYLAHHWCIACTALCARNNLEHDLQLRPGNVLRHDARRRDVPVARAREPQRSNN
jgi:hypothetical protein